MGDKDKTPIPIEVPEAPPAKKAEPAESPAARAARELAELHDAVAAHCADGNSKYLTVREHAELRGFQRRRSIDITTNAVVMKPHAAIAALLGRFRAQGIHEDSRISKEVFEKALDEALHGRI